MIETLLFLTVPTCIWINHRRELWKYRAKVAQREIKVMSMAVKAEQDANAELIKRIPGAIMHKPRTDWPEEFDI